MTAHEPNTGDGATDTPQRVIAYGLSWHLCVLTLFLFLGWGIPQSIRNIIVLMETTGDVTVRFVALDLHLSHNQGLAFHLAMFVFCAYLTILAIAQLTLRPRIRLWHDRICVPKHLFGSKQVIIPYPEITKVTTQSAWALSRRYWIEITHPGGCIRVFDKRLSGKKKGLDDLTDWLRQKCRPGVVEVSLDPQDDLTAGL